jgi:hypothetical protein
MNQRSRIETTYLKPCIESMCAPASVIAAGPAAPNVRHALRLDYIWRSGERRCANHVLSM